MGNLFKRWVGDPALFLAALVMTSFGIAMIYSAGVLNIPSPITEGAWILQIQWAAISLVAFVVIWQIGPRWIEWVAVPAYVLCVILLLATLFVGAGSGTAAGVRSFLEIGPIRFQPSELAKLTTILALARYLGTRPEDPATLRALVNPVAIVGVPFVLIILQPDLGTALAFVGILFAALFWAGTPIGLLALLMSPGISLVLSFDPRIWTVSFVFLVLALYLYRYRLFLVESLAVVLANLAAGTISTPLWNSLADYQQNRILVFLDPSVDPRGAGYHVVQSMVAIGSGGLTGNGFTEGTQKRFDFLPEQHTDFIFSVIGEELGYLGTIFTLLLFAVILYRLVRMAEGEADPFAGLVIFGIFGAWLVHVFVNVGMTVGMVPVTGIPLPFVSYGGTFLLMSWVAVAVAARLVGED
ncbi:MAG TPA: rod shape-determining protein RodA [Gemmatimonadetes bacterium]|nr:rod shape-determining protein RodA [Gemmatimonadota bacterium]